MWLLGLRLFGDTPGDRSANGPNFRAEAVRSHAGRGLHLANWADFGPNVAEGGPDTTDAEAISADSVPRSVDAGPSSVDLGRTRACCGRTRAKFGCVPTNCGRFLASVGRFQAHFGRVGPISAQIPSILGRSWPNLVVRWEGPWWKGPEVLTRIRPISEPKLRRIWPTLGRTCRPSLSILARILPCLGLFGPVWREFVELVGPNVANSEPHSADFGRKLPSLGAFGRGSDSKIHHSSSVFPCPVSLKQGPPPGIRNRDPPSIQSRYVAQSSLRKRAVRSDPHLPPTPGMAENISPWSHGRGQCGARAARDGCGCTYRASRAL